MIYIRTSNDRVYYKGDITLKEMLDLIDVYVYIYVSNNDNNIREDIVIFTEHIVSLEEV